MKGDFAYIQTASDVPIESIEEFFPVEQWTEAYAHQKWKSFVYAPLEFVGPVRDAAISLLKEQMGLEIDVQKSNQACHLS